VYGWGGGIGGVCVRGGGRGEAGRRKGKCRAKLLYHGLLQFLPQKNMGKPKKAIYETWSSMRAEEETSTTRGLRSQKKTPIASFIDSGF